MLDFTPPASATKKDFPSIWVTWLAPLINGDKHCRWAAWFQANHKFDKDTDEGFLKDWTRKHEALLYKRAEQLETEGYRVYIEGENYFKVTSKSSTFQISGKPDIVAIRGDEIVVEDCKTGKQKSYDYTQVFIYMMLLPLAGGPPHCRGKKLEGRLVYSEDDVIDIPSSLLIDEFKSNFRDVVHQVGGEQPARKVPSLSECRFCNARNHCPERADQQQMHEQEEHDLF